MRSILLVAFLSLMLFACSKSADSPIIQSQGTVTGSANTCGGWLIQDQNKKILQPVNWDDFTITLKTGQALSFSYYKVDGGNLCQMGQTIHLVTAKDRQ
jgi:hypothetical protein